MNEHERDPLRLGSTALQGAAVMLASKYAGTVAALTATAVIARFVTPEEIGLVTAALATMAIARCFEEFGLGDAVVQRIRLEPGQVSVLFWINAAMGTALGLLFAALAVPIARFFGQDALVPLVLVLAITFPLGSLGGMHRALLRRSFRFRALATANALATGSGAVAGITIAVAGGGSWAIVGQTLVNSLTYLIGCLWASGWRPERPRRGTNVRPLLRYGVNLVSASFLGQITRNLDSILIAKFVGPTALGAYDRAFQLMMLPGTHFNQPLNVAAVPALSRLQHDPEAYRRLYLRLNVVVVSMSFPIAVFSAVAAPAIVGTLLGPNWSESATLLRLLAPCGLLVALNVSITWVYSSLGRTGQQLRWMMFSVPVVITGICAGLPWGAVGVAIGLSAARILLRIPSLRYAYRGTPLRVRDLGAITWPPALAAMAAGLVALLADPYGWAMPLRLTAQAVTFGVAYAGLFRLLPGGRERFGAIRDEWTRWRRAPRAGVQDHA